MSQSLSLMNLELHGKAEGGGETGGQVLQVGRAHKAAAGTAAAALGGGARHGLSLHAT